MEITEVRIFLKDGSDKKLKAYATVTFDNAFVVRNIKVIEGQKGLFVAMPSRKLKEACPKCNFKNAVRSKFCNSCGANLPVSDGRFTQTQDSGQRESEHRDIAHPITLECREYLQKKVLEAYEAERSGHHQGAAPARGAESSPPAAPTPKREEKPDLEGDLEI